MSKTLKDAAELVAATPRMLPESYYEAGAEQFREWAESAEGLAVISSLPYPWTDQNPYWKIAEDQMLPPEVK